MVHHCALSPNLVLSGPVFEAAFRLYSALSLVCCRAGFIVSNGTFVARGRNDPRGRDHSPISKTLGSIRAFAGTQQLLEVCGLRASDSTAVCAGIGGSAIESISPPRTPFQSVFISPL